MSAWREQDRRFVEELRALVDRRDRASLAALRRGLGKEPGEASEMFPFVWSHMPRDVNTKDEAAYFLVAALFAWHPSNWEASGERRERTNFGASFARLAQRRESESIEARFVALLNAHPDDLPDHLRHAVGLLKAEDIPVDWAQLLGDIQHWEAEHRPVQRRWARAYWGYAPETAVGLDGMAGSPEPAEHETEEG